MSIDNLFRNKLAEHSVAPSANAWAKVEAGLTKKNNGLIWFRWAAALLIPVLLAGVFMLTRSPSLTTTIAAVKNTEDNKNARREVKKEAATPKATTSSSPELKSKPAVQKKGTQKSTTAPAAPGGLPNEAGTTVAMENEKPVSLPEQPAAESTAAEVVAAPLTTAVAPAPTEKSIVLEYTLASIEPDAPVEKGITLTMELKEKKGFRKVIDFARDAKNSEGPFAALRQAKQELFAFNFTKKDKHPK